MTCNPATNQKTAINGSAIFAGCAIDKISPTGNTYTLHAVSSLASVTATNTGAIVITVGPAAMLAFTTQPAGAATRTAFTTQPGVSIEDAGGNIVGADNTTPITLSITPLTGDPTATLTCTPSTTQRAINGTASFSGCAIDKASPGYRLRASGAGFNQDSEPFPVS